MTPMPARTPTDHLRTLVHAGPLGGLTDGQLLERFATGPEAEAGPAFEAVVERHGAMVLRACRGILRDDHEALDAFQATFLVLLHKRRSLWVRDSLGPWLHRVACRAAGRARARGSRRRALEQGAAERLLARGPNEGRDERAAALHEELDRLPDRLRVPIVLCDLEGQTCEEAARVLGKSVRTVKNWRARGRDRLRARLAARGLSAPVFPLTGLPVSTLARAEARRAIAGAVAAPVAALTEGVLRSMLLTKIKAAAAALILLAGVVGALGAVQAPTPGPEQPPKPVPIPQDPVPAPQPVAAAEPPDREVCDLTLRRAIRIDLANSRVARIVPDADPASPRMVVEPVDPLDAMGRAAFSVGLAARVRSVEQAYRDLYRCNFQDWSRQTAVRFGEAAVDRERSRPTRLNPEALRQAEAILADLRRDGERSTAARIKAERRLRDVLGLPPADELELRLLIEPINLGRRDRWEDGPAEIVGLKAILAWIKDDLLSGRNVFTPGRSAPPRVGPVLSSLIEDSRRRHQRYQAAKRLQLDAGQQFALEQHFFRTGHNAVDRYLDALKQSADAAVQELASRGEYQESLMALEDHQGNLLQRREIVVAPPKATAPGPIPRPEEIAEPRPPANLEPAGVGPGKAISFRFMLGGGPKPLEVRGSFSIAPAAPAADPAP